MSERLGWIPVRAKFNSVTMLGWLSAVHQQEEVKKGIVSVLNQQESEDAFHQSFGCFQVDAENLKRIRTKQKVTRNATVVVSA